MGNEKADNTATRRTTSLPDDPQCHTAQVRRFRHRDRDPEPGGDYRVRVTEPARTALPVPVLFGAMLAAAGARFVLVGSAALWLRGFAVAVGDVDIVADLDATNLERLC